MRQRLNQAALFSGFVFYNLGCFDTDILNAPLTASYSMGVTSVSVAFLVVTVSAFSFGVSVVVVSSFARLVYKMFPAKCLQGRFAAGLDQVLASVSLIRWLPMLSFMISFALLGCTKMVPPRAESVVITVIGLIWGDQRR